jgi:oxygen-independent coproporphyrinogen-3 oxidase
MDGAIKKHLSERVPRYTSYPTAPYFTPQVGPATYRSWLEGLPATARLSLYLHVPFCQSLCWYCGCHTKIPGHREPIDRYVETLEREIALVADLLAEKRQALHIHWGGGTPTIIGPEPFARVMALLRQRFSVDPDAEIAVEIDPRRLSLDMARALGAAGINRASLGVQSFDPAVQRGVNRIQSLEVTRATADLLRSNGVAKLNVDLLYGLPHETAASCRDTVAAALTLAPDRLAVFGYAHVPTMKRHQKRLDEAALPGSEARLEQEQAIGDALVAAGYVRIGLDHYARAEDALARAQAAGRLRRNFQGYTDDPADALIGFGASSIGELPQGYVQNAAGISDWSEAVTAGRLPTARGVAVNAEDRLRRSVIERLMCDLTVDIAAEARRHGFPADTLSSDLAMLQPLAADGLVHIQGSVVTVPESARPILRRIASAFDAYLDPAAGRHAVAV